jgi:N-acetylneuraminic acid mutarotase
MTKPRDPDALLSAYLADGMTVLPDRVTDVVLAEVHRNRRRAVVSPWRTRSMTRTTFAVAAVFAVVALVGASFAIQRGLPAAGGPGPAATVSVSAPPNQNAALSWTATGSMAEARTGATSTLLPDGRVLVAGGLIDSKGLVSAELYDPRTGTWTTTGSMRSGRGYHTAMLLGDGTVLVFGGISVAGGPGEDIEVASAELYDPRTGSWSATGSMSEARTGGASTVLPDGRVLVAGGWGSTEPFGPKLASAELYDPVTGAWTATGSMSERRHGHSATLLPNGTVLVTGGNDAGRLKSAELFDPATGTWTTTGSLPEPFGGHADILLPNGTVLVAGGDVPSGSGAVGSAHAALYDPATRTWTMVASMHTPRLAHLAVLLPNGRVLVMGGQKIGSPYSGFASAEVFDPVDGTWTAIPDMTQARSGHTATLLPGGRVLVAGGLARDEELASAELYDQ